jgi:L-rhamnono-1,4-lactonase
MEKLASFDKVYMKLSGAFSEIGDQEAEAPWPVSKVVNRMRPWLEVIFRSFGPNKTMFGSDWPVCNVRGPGDAASWQRWRVVVEAVLEDFGFLEGDKDRIWFGTAAEAYKVDTR